VSAGASQSPSTGAAHRGRASAHPLRAADALAGKTAVVTGAARGIGAGLAAELARRGASLALVGLEPAELSATADRCTELARGRSTRRARPPAPACTANGDRLARAWVADVTDREHMGRVAAEVAEYFGQVDIVVANAGIAIGGPFADADPAEFDRVIEVNLLGSAVTARAFLPLLAASRGYLLQIASLAALVPSPLMAAYCASKSGVEALAHALRAEVAYQGIGVGVAYLTWTDTDMVRGADKDEVLRELRARVPGPASRTAPLRPAVERLADGIARRSTHVYAQPWVRAAQWLPRGLLPWLVAWRGSAEVAQLAATAAQRQRPVGPGGQAGSASAARTAGGSAPPAEPR
jgi:NAD(P)-dependent dehydrogenase (short-subunit alcohol dehydrogenase family)